MQSGWDGNVYAVPVQGVVHTDVPVRHNTDVAPSRHVGP